MAMSSGVVSMVRRLAIIHIVVGALLIIFGIADGATIERDGGYVFSGSSSVLYGLWIGIWVSVHCCKKRKKNAYQLMIYLSTHCRNSAFVRCKLIFLAFLPTRSSRLETT